MSKYKYKYNIRFNRDDGYHKITIYNINNNYDWSQTPLDPEYIVSIDNLSRTDWLLFSKEYINHRSLDLLSLDSLKDENVKKILELMEIYKDKGITELILEKKIIHIVYNKKVYKYQDIDLKTALNLTINPALGILQIIKNQK